MPDAFRWGMSNTLDEPVPPVIEGTILLSSSILPPRETTRDEYLPFLQSEPIALIGGSVFVYRGRFEIPLASAISRTYRVGQFLRLNQVNEAVAEGRAAVELAPADPRTHLSLGLALIRAGQKDEARREFEIVIELAKPNPVFRNAEVRALQEIERLN